MTMTISATNPARPLGKALFALSLSAAVLIGGSSWGQTKETFKIGMLNECRALSRTFPAPGP
ncbi:hypothetical protein SAMN05428997_10472 [Bosea sp. CRIB-10]|nr:hypothetical protein SAMN05428997_10472 [Bosea sp. CRIB-10]